MGEVRLQEAGSTVDCVKKAQPQSSPHLGLMCSVQSVQCGATVRQLCLAVPCNAQVDEATKECVNHNQRNAC